MHLRTLKHLRVPGVIKSNNIQVPSFYKRLERVHCEYYSVLRGIKARFKLAKLLFSVRT